MRQKDLYLKNIKLVNILEEKLNKNQLKYKNIKLLPFIRLLLFTESNIKNIIKLNKKNFISRFVFFFLRIHNIIIKKIKYIFDIYKLKKKKIDLIFFSHNQFYYDNIENKKTNLFIDPYFKALKKKFNSLKVEIVPINYKNKNNKLFEPYYLNLLNVSTSSYIKKFFGLNSENEKNTYKNFNLKYVKSIIGNSQYIKMNKKLDQIIFDYQIIKIFLKQLKPKIVFFNCYYLYENFSLILACKDLGIKTVDIQHGGQELYHLMYSNWFKPQKNGYELLPEYFWVWGKNQKNDGFLNHKKTKHKYMVGGKLQLNFWKKNKNYFDKYLKEEKKLFLSNAKKYDKIIMFAVTFEIPDIVIDLIKSSPKNWLWLFRYHPRHTNMAGIEKKLYKLKNFNVEFKFSSKVDLNFLLNNITHVIVEYSSVIYDAEYFNVSSIILNKKKIFKKYNSKKMLFSENKKNILNFIKKNNKTKGKNCIISNEKFAISAVNKIFKSSN
tara:strand:+ start:1090 stop:2568 length:1479 start_codon:yes stop_codon:yes gene_type:complete